MISFEDYLATRVPSRVNLYPPVILDLPCVPVEKAIPNIIKDNPAKVGLWAKKVGEKVFWEAVRREVDTEIARITDKK
jgi:hypothetical protein